LIYLFHDIFILGWHMIPRIQFKYWHFLCCLCITTFVVPFARADLLVPANSAITVANGVMDLGCADITVAGTLNLISGKITNVRSLTIQSGGRINGDAGAIELSGNWSNNSGSATGFVGGTSVVSFIDNAACATSSTISGNTIFASLNLTTTVGKIFTLAAGSTQGVTGQLNIIGTPAIALVLNSSVLNQFATIDVRGSQRIADVAANWIAVTGTWLGVGLVNRNPNGVTQRFFGLGETVQEVPTLSPLNLIILILMLGVASVKKLRSRWPK
jgi:hypothetical protein